jgi:hypothetical protein
VNELEAQLRRLVAGVAETGHSKFLVAAIAERERELAIINHELSGTGESSVDTQMKDLRQFVETRLADIRQLMGSTSKGRGQSFPNTSLRIDWCHPKTATWLKGSGLYLEIEPGLSWLRGTALDPVQSFITT